jgi:ATP-dependent Clp protease ATP-binding subunit ClpB
LLDEIEKAHPDVFNILLQVLDDGRLTDSQGRTVDFRNSIIVMTSNLGSSIIQELSKKEAYGEIKQAVMEVVSQHFRPEFVNRIDEIVTFSPLFKDQIRHIAVLQTEHLKSRLKAQNIDLSVSDEALNKLTEAGYDPVYGARPLKRVIRQMVENPLANALLSGQFGPGDCLQLSLKDNGFTFEKLPGTANNT